jgi:hypothetical protein
MNTIRMFRRGERSPGVYFPCAAIFLDLFTSSEVEGNVRFSKLCFKTDTEKLHGRIFQESAKNSDGI